MLISNNTSAPIGKTHRERTREFRGRMARENMRQVTIWVPTDRASQVQMLAEALRSNRDLEVGPMRDTVSGKLVRLG